MLGEASWADSLSRPSILVMNAADSDATDLDAAAVSADSQHWVFMAADH